MKLDDDNFDSPIYDHKYFYNDGIHMVKSAYSFYDIKEEVDIYI